MIFLFFLPYYGVTKYGSGWRKDVVNQWLEFGENLDSMEEFTRDDDGSQPSWQWLVNNNTEKSGQSKNVS